MPDSSWQGPFMAKGDHGWGRFMAVLSCGAGNAHLLVWHQGPADRQLRVLFGGGHGSSTSSSPSVTSDLLGPKEDVPSAAASHVCTHIITISDPMFIV